MFTVKVKPKLRALSVLFYIKTKQEWFVADLGAKGFKKNGAIACCRVEPNNEYLWRSIFCGSELNDYLHEHGGELTLGLVFDYGSMNDVEAIQVRAMYMDGSTEVLYSKSKDEEKTPKLLIEMF